jgi:hypothetical protein
MKMKTNRFFTTLITLSLVIFMSTSGISNTAFYKNIENLEKSGNKVTTEMSASNEASAEFSYLRFDVNAYTIEATANEMPVSTLDNLRFDVNAFTESTGSEITELPVPAEFEHLRFDVNRFAGNSTDVNDELPVNDFEYLNFDVDNYTSNGNSAIDELPVTE